ncbi:hypothetical protein [Erythrobacter sp. F6033]|uniref:hypothetical protein n=1 Tax=Erythrobacter sp. F6033 TaxID=2926401 RepID=UPI001FF694CC|nr:hypothetical protein [Erythrobacter sp. F6033]MCK0129502.1 hypothetical protein [Erythrobacter sp. F6033]
MIIARALLAGICLACAAIISAPASATPPDVIDIHERPFGVSDTHLFVLRSSSDNLGLHESLRVETFLVAIDLKSGAEKMWVIDRLTQYRDYAENGDQLDYVTKRDDGLKLVNPYAVLIEYGAVPWDGVTRIGSGWIEPQIVQSEAAITVTYGEDTTFHVTAEALASKLDGLHTFMTKNVADHQRLSTISTREMFADRGIPVTACKPQEVLDYWSMGEGPGKLLRVVCTLGEDDGVTVMVVPLEDVDQPEKEAVTRDAELVR